MYESVFRRDLFRSQRILITGGGTGIGRCTAHELASLGAHVIIAGRNKETLLSVVREITSQDQRCDYVVVDVRNPGKVVEAVKFVFETFGPIHGLVNNAGGQFPSPAENISDNGWRAVIDLNLNGTWNFIKAVFAARSSLPRTNTQPLSIVNVIADIRNGKLFMAHTAAARAGVENLTKTLSQEWGRYGVRVNCVAPGTILGNGMSRYDDTVREQTVKTQYMNPIGRLGTEAEVSTTIAFLLSPSASYITGTTIQITGGAHLRKGMENEFIPYDPDCKIPVYFGFSRIVDEPGDKKEEDDEAKVSYFAGNKIPKGFEDLVTQYSNNNSKL
ncbi:UNVERIFIED_CONTAM: hypothetical protein HDU68_009442 [Siphonaria sp. JEL0065]|nr:hypothetical protein HDU68_009442 [Siphonaria sp. JEL0065]